MAYTSTSDLVKVLQRTYWPRSQDLEGLRLSRVTQPRTDATLLGRVMTVRRYYNEIRTGRRRGHAKLVRLLRWILARDPGAEVEFIEVVE